MINVVDYERLKEKCREILRGEGGWRDKLEEICELLHREVSHYNWVGFYLVERPSSKGLVLGPYRGEPTEHVKIPFGRGICGQAAERRETFVVDDVRRESNYLACSVKVLSEIVVPIMRGEQVLGEIDIDSHTLSAFSGQDREFLEWLSGEVERVLP
ncbi:MAG: GAF domain-containing protein [Thermoplasmata archaeon]|nr:MAG: GAF domain-containing protein [Thermoplasmata archaeon]RLF69687.1 MAG: GAF domain-containing protein [Thermoplasmata archaeon]RLF70359.1 MAG: GAF domain-containing protein [Thermoplasmata archaeon]RLF73154.1 MAG: GAF domain-containing protein [Thermoplasmata archaeon]HDD60043.1 GAF domain-containing protein [Euryarchaeota archaeon]